MLLILKKRATEEEISNAAQDLDGYIKFVTDVKRGIIAVGGLKHVDGEQLLLNDGSKQEDLWGGALDLETDEIDFDSMINIRPRQDNPSRQVLSREIRDKIVKIVGNLLK